MSQQGRWPKENTQEELKHKLENRSGGSYERMNINIEGYRKFLTKTEN
jgi:hypothetical protein